MVRFVCRVLIGVLLTYIGIRLATGIPLTDGIYSERYQESQLQPDSYVYLSGFVCRLAFDSIGGGLRDEVSSQRKAFGRSCRYRQFVGRPVLLFRILSARTV